MRKFWVLTFLASFFLAPPLLADTAQEAGACVLDDSTLIAQSKLEYRDFHYGANGWRPLTDAKCYAQAAASIVSWLVDHQKSLTPGQVRTSHYQAARNFAFAGQREVALVQLHMAYVSDQPKDVSMDWNAYLDAFSAWLENDQAAYETAIAQLQAQAVDENGKKPNVAAAARFANCWNKNYTAIEYDPACEVGKQAKAIP